jgi:hypothetical protein
MRARSYNRRGIGAKVKRRLSGSPYRSVLLLALSRRLRRWNKRRFGIKGPSILVWELVRDAGFEPATSCV